MKSLIEILVFTLLTAASAIGQWVSLTGPEGKPVAVTLREDIPSGTVIEFKTPGYYRGSVDIQGKAHSVLSIPKAVTFLEKGYPELPRISRSIMISDEAKMKVQVVEAEYETTYVAPIAPSKGNLLRSEDPRKIPYTFSDIYNTDTFWPQQVIELSEPFIMRDIRGITVRFNLFRYNAVRGQLISCKRLVVRVFADGIDNINVKTSGKGIITRDMIETYDRFFLNFSQRSGGALGKVSYTAIGDTGRMLIIAADDFYNSMIPLRDWRTRKGHRTTLVKCSDVGTTVSAVQAYIQNMYNSEGSVLYILLVGEANSADIPTKSVPSDEYPDYRGYAPWDPKYAKLAGADDYPDAYVSRISAENIDQVENQVMRILEYETNPVSGSWFQKGTGIASNDDGGTGIRDWERCNLLRTDLTNYGYTTVDQIYDPGATASQVTTAMNNGRSIVNYIGHGSETSWATSGFSAVNASALSNTNMLPFVFSVACQVGSFNYPSVCLAEAWLRAGTKDNPTGGIGFYGSSIDQSWVPPTVAQAEAVDLLVADAKVTIGGLCFNGSCKMIEQTGDVAMFNTWHIFGDAATHVWTKTPMNFTSTSITDNGSSITVNAGVAGSTICVSSGNNGSSFWDRRDNVSNYTFNTSVRPLYITVTKHNYIPYTAVTGGTFTSSEYWFGKVNVLDNIFVASGTTLTVDPGTEIRFKPSYTYYDEEEEYITVSTNLVCNGKLLVNGSASSPVVFTSTDGSSGWGTISLDGSGANGSTISYANIQYGTQIDVLNASNVTIQNSTITDYSMHAINCYGSTGSTVLYNTISSSNIYHGIIIQNGTLTCTGNKVIKTDPYRNGVGIFYGGGSSGYVRQNDVRGWNWGICGIWGAYPSSYLGNYWYDSVNNRVTNCQYGLMVYHSSYANFGDEDPSSCWKNSIYGNTVKNASVGISYPSYESGLYAVDNWWGGAPPDESKFSVGYNSWFEYEPYLDIDPWIGIPLPSIVITDNGLKNSGISASILMEGNIGQNSAPVSENTKVTSSTKYRVGIELLRQHRYAEAKDFFKAYLAKNLNDVLVHVLLYNCYSDETAKEILQYFESLPNTASPDLKMILSYLYLKQGNVELAKGINNTIIEQNKNTELAAKAKLNNFFIALYDENNIQEAEVLFKEVVSQSKLSTPMELLLAEAAFKSYVDPKTGRGANFQGQQNAKAITSVQPVQSALLDCYPNPFNPTTAISYQLSAISKVRLKVYDMLGREIAVLADGMKEAGYYNATFNASGLASGIYFARFTATPQNGFLPFSQTMKMLFTK